MDTATKTKCIDKHIDGGHRYAYVVWCFNTSSLTGNWLSLPAEVEFPHE